MFCEVFLVLDGIPFPFLLSLSVSVPVFLRELHANKNQSRPIFNIRRVLEGGSEVRRALDALE